MLANISCRNVLKINEILKIDVKDIGLTNIHNHCRCSYLFTTIIT